MIDPFGSPQIPVSSPRLILLFVKWPEPGRVKTRLARDTGDPRAVEIYRELVATVIDRLPAAEFEELRICFDPPERLREVREWLSPRLERLGGRVRFEPQVAGDLGNRLGAAFDSAFAGQGDRGARVLAIGSDCPEITRADLARAFEALAEPATDAVFGPTPDGGYYLVGIDAPRPELFREIPWSVETTLSASLEAARAAGLRVELLDPRHDVDTAADWHRFCGLEEPSNPVKSIDEPG